MSFIDDFIYRRGILLNSFVDPKEEELDTDDLEVLYLKIIFGLTWGLIVLETIFCTGSFYHNIFTFNFPIFELERELIFQI